MAAKLFLLDLDFFVKIGVFIDVRAINYYSDNIK